MEGKERKRTFLCKYANNPHSQKQLYNLSLFQNPVMIARQQFHTSNLITYTSFLMNYSSFLIHSSLSLASIPMLFFGTDSLG